MTRAKQRLTLLQHHQRHHQALAAILPARAEHIDLPSVPVPDFLQFHRFLRLDEMVLTPPELVTDEGRAFVTQTFCRNGWSEQRQSITGQFTVCCQQQDKFKGGFYSRRGQQIARFSKTFGETYAVNGQGNDMLSMTGFTTTLFYQQDLSWYERAGYLGSETSHYLIVPLVRFSVRCA